MTESLLSTRAQKAFMLTILIQGLVVLAMVATTFAFVAEHVNLDLPQYKTLPCYLALFMLAELFELLMAFDALRLRSVIQLVGILLFHLALLVFAALQVHETRAALVRPGSTGWMYESGAGSLWRKVLPYLVVAPVMIATSWVSLIFWIRELYIEFGWAIFHVVGANPEMKVMYQFYQVLICLLKFDFFCFTGVTIQLLIVVLQRNSAEFGITIAAIPIVLMLLIGAGIAVQREIKWLMSISLVLMLAAESYFYKLVRFYEPDSREQYQTTRATLTTFTIVAFVLLFATFAVGLRCFADFDKGLQNSKLHGQSYAPVSTSGPNKIDLFGDYSFPYDSDVTARKKHFYSSTPMAPTPGEFHEQKQNQTYFSGGEPLQPRISIE